MFGQKKTFLTFTIPGIGEVLVEKSLRAKRLRLTVGFGGIRVAVPRRVHLEKGREFAISQQDWIRHHLRRLACVAEASRALTAQLPPRESKHRAREILVSRLNELSLRHGLPYRSISIRAQKTRWGSCGSQGNISLNIKLARMPRHLMDYVILHELMHTRIRGHGKQFWQALAVLLPDVQNLRVELSRYHTEFL